MKIIFSVQSRLDIIEITNYIAELQSQNKFKRELKNSLRNSRVFPQMGRFIPELENTNYKNLNELIVLNYRIVYRIERKQIVILRIIDSRSLLNFNKILGVN